MAATNETYCMNCFSLISAEAEICPVCRENITSLSGQDFREKLLQALDHPSDDVRMRVITILVLRHEEGTALQLAKCALRHPLSIAEGMEIVNSLKNYQAFPDGNIALKILSQNHSAHAVRAAAQEALKEKTT